MEQLREPKLGRLAGMQQPMVEQLLGTLRQPLWMVELVQWLERERRFRRRWLGLWLWFRRKWLERDCRFLEWVWLEQLLGTLGLERLVRSVLVGSVVVRPILVWRRMGRTFVGRLHRLYCESSDR